VLGVAAAVRLDGGVCRDARIVLGAVASTPREVPEAARVLVGQRLEPEVIARAAEAAARPAKPLDNTDLVYHYRKRMTRVYVARALRELAGLPVEGLWPTGMSGRIAEEAG
jgi:carbon-monoxide dehydrogenase medium subunit